MIRDQFAELVRQHQQEDEFGFRLEQCACGEAFDGTYAEHLADVLVRELGLADEERAFAISVPDDPPRTRCNQYTGFVEAPVTHIEFIQHTRSQSAWYSDECPDCEGEFGVHDRLLAEALADEQALKLWGQRRTSS